MIDDLFKSYIEMTKNILSGVENGIPVDEFFEKREKIIESILADNESKEVKKMKYTNSGAEELDKYVVEHIKEEMKKTKEAFKKANENKRLYSSYVTNNMSVNIFRRTI